jgi:hypothetical protein
MVVRGLLGVEDVTSVIWLLIYRRLEAVLAANLPWA